jgi:competence ComEA-like helix-hairpin-helix protein
MGIWNLRLKSNSTPLLQAGWRRLGLVGLAFGLGACQAQAQGDLPVPLPQDGAIRVYMNHNPATTYTEPYRQQTRAGDDLEAQLVAAIDSAQTSVDLAVQELRLPNVAQALAQRHRAGVRVRVILEDTYSQPLSRLSTAAIAALPEREQRRYKEFRLLADRDRNGQVSPEEIQQSDALVILDQAKVPRIDDRADGSRGSNLMHHKFLVVDRRRVIVTSANATTSDIHGDFQSPASRGNANNMVAIDSADIADLFIEEFNLMWGDGPKGKPDSKFGIQKPHRPARTLTVGSSQVTVHFSPTATTRPWSVSSNGLIGRTLSTAQSSIDLALFVFSDQALVNQMATVHHRGTPIRVLIHPEFAYRPYSEAFDLWGTVLPDDRCQLEPNNRPWQPPLQTVGVPRLISGDMLHHKFGLVDQRTVITGSHNWSAAANSGNDETVLVVQNPMIAAHFQREFDRLYSEAILGIPPAVQKKIDRQTRRCGSMQPPSSPAGASPANPPKTDSSQPGSSQPQPEQLPTAADHRVNLNTATLAELETLPGVGPSLARRIVAARQQRPFQSLTDLDTVPGVGKKLLERLADKVTW